MKFNVEVLRDNVPIGTLKLISGDVKYNSESRIKRAANIIVAADELNSNKGIRKNEEYLYPASDLYPSENLFLKSQFTFSSELSLNKMKDRIRIMIDKQSIGKFMIVSSPKKINENQKTYEFELYDESYKIDEASLSNRMYFPKGTLYLSVIKTILTNYDYPDVINDDSAAVLSTDREWEIGENVLDIVNELLKEINFNSFFLDENGVARLTKKDKKIVPAHVYKEGNLSKIRPDINVSEDVYKIPNVFIGVVSRPEAEPLIYRRVNDNPDSIVSTIGRGFEIVRVENLNDIANEEELKNYIDDIYLQSIQTVEKIEFSSAIESGHTFQELIQIDTRNISGIYKEIAWNIDLSPYGKMTHTAERKSYQ